MELLAFLAVGLVLGAVTVYAEVMEPAPVPRAAVAMTISEPDSRPAFEPITQYITVEMAAPAFAPMPSAAFEAPMPKVEATDKPTRAEASAAEKPASPPAATSTRRSHVDRRVSVKAQRSEHAAMSSSQTNETTVQAAEKGKERPARSANRRSTRREAAILPALPTAPLPSVSTLAPPMVAVTEQLAQSAGPSRPRPMTRAGTPIYAAETPEGLMDLACFELISGERSFVGPDNGGFLAKFDLERVGVTCRYGALEGPATYVLSPNRIYGYSGTVWANVWRMLPQDVRELRVRFETKETPVTDRRSRSPRRSSIWDGDAVGFDRQGRVLLMARFSQGNFDGPLQVRSPTGVTIFSGNFRALPEGGVPHGPFTLANQSGRVVARRFFCNGYPVGVHQFYSTRGEVIAREDYRSVQQNVGECPWRNDGEGPSGRRGA